MVKLRVSICPRLWVLSLAQQKDTIKPTEEQSTTQKSFWDPGPGKAFLRRLCLRFPRHCYLKDYKPWVYQPFRLSSHPCRVLLQHHTAGCSLPTLPWPTLIWNHYGRATPEDVDDIHFGSSSKHFNSLAENSGTGESSTL